jgi:hypothetical protein
MTIAIHTEQSGRGRNGKLRFPRKSANAKQRAFANGFRVKARERPPERSPKVPGPMVPDQAPETIAAEPVPKTAVSIRQLSATSCRWPLWTGETPLSGRLYCGAQVDTQVEGCSYCPRHLIRSIRGGA